MIWQDVTDELKITKGRKLLFDADHLLAEIIHPDYRFRLTNGEIRVEKRVEVSCSLASVNA